MGRLAMVNAPTYGGFLPEEPDQADVIPYSAFNSGISWDQVRDELTAEQDAAREAGTYMFVSRGTVLGRMHQHKREMYDAYLRSIGEDPETWENPPGLELGDVRYLGYRHAQDGELYEHEFRPGAEIDALSDGTLRITHAGGRSLHRDYDGQQFLVNPPKEKKRMASTAQPRYKSGPKKGQFMSRRAAATKRAPAKRRRAAAAPRAKARRRAPARRNPPRRRSIPTVKKLVRQTMDGTMDAGLLLVGKAAVRTLPMVAGLPKQGNLGIAVQALTALALSIVSGNLLKPAQSRMVLAGGLSAPLETLIVSYNVPFLGAALQPVEGDAQLSAYMGGYVSSGAVDYDQGVAGYVEPGLGIYGDPNYA